MCCLPSTDDQLMLSDVQVLPLEGQKQVVAELAGNEAIGKCCYDSNGNHVIQKCIECIRPSDHIPCITQVAPPQDNTLSLLQ